MVNVLAGDAPWIATRVLSADDPSVTVQVSIGAPEVVGPQEWRCGYRVTVVRSKTDVSYAQGLDAFQALLNALIGIRADLDKTELTLSWLDGRLVHGFPQFIPQFLGREFAGELEAFVESKVAEHVARLKRQRGP